MMIDRVHGIAEYSTRETSNAADEMKVLGMRGPKDENRKVDNACTISMEKRASDQRVL